VSISTHSATLFHMDGLLHGMDVVIRVWIDGLATSGGDLCRVADKHAGQGNDFDHHMDQPPHWLAYVVPFPLCSLHGPESLLYFINKLQLNISVGSSISSFVLCRLKGLCNQWFHDSFVFCLAFVCLTLTMIDSLQTSCCRHLPVRVSRHFLRRPHGNIEQPSILAEHRVGLCDGRRA